MKLIKWFKDAMSIDEAKTSIMIIVFVIYSLFGIYFYWVHKELTDNYVLILQTLVVAIGSVNVTKLIKKKDKDENLG